MNPYDFSNRKRRSIRLKGYDYSQAGLYFITICCENRICRFGKIQNGEMILNEYGRIAYNEWEKTPDIRNHVELGEFIIMPNHIHGIIRLGELHSPKNETRCTDKLHSPENKSTSHSNFGECNSKYDRGKWNSKYDRGECNSPLRSPSQTVGAIVRGYKSSVTKQLNLMGFHGKLWQRNYYEHIIRNEQSHHRISHYIINNPAKWQMDK